MCPTFKKLFFSSKLKKLAERESIIAIRAKGQLISNQKNKGTLYHQLDDFILTILHYFIDLTSF